MSRKIVKHCLLTLSGILILLWAVCVRPAGDIGDTRIVAAADPTGTVTGTATPTPTNTPTPTPTASPANEAIAETYVEYANEQISVHVKAAGTQVYYAPVKNETVTGVKLSELLPAAQNNNGMYYYIDISTLSASKVNYIGITTLNTAGTDGLVPVAPVKVAASQKKIVFNVDWSYEGTPTQFDGLRVLQNIVVSNNDNTTVTYAHLTSAETQVLKEIADLRALIQWRKGANGAWKNIDNLEYTDWTSMLNSGAIIYFRLAATNQTQHDEGARFSKENKLKIAITKAPAIKVDVSKLNLPVKNGMQFRQNGKKDWYTVLPFAANSTNPTAILTTAFSPFTNNTSAKVSMTSIDDIKKALKYNEPVSAAALTIDVRVAATTKKPASRVGMVSIPYQGKAPVVSGITKAGEQYTIGAITAADMLVTAPAYEMCIVAKADYDARLVDYSSITWSTVKAGTVLKANLKSVYTKLDAAKTRVTAKITDTTSVILIRRRGVAGSAKAEAILASEPCVVTIPTN
ncbi:MAG: hypothetical protein IK001_06605 [Lachnospiraceae bacterium]|nr:hypothetical protein [Lachnospiraceae bacterium]MBR5968250.1 hypothetical protein [Lachnospiraceae bacterium]